MIVNRIELCTECVRLSYTEAHDAQRNISSYAEHEHQVWFM